MLLMILVTMFLTMSRFIQPQGWARPLIPKDGGPYVIPVLFSRFTFIIGVDESARNIYTLNPPWRDSFKHYHELGDVKWSPCTAPMRGFHQSYSRVKMDVHSGKGRI